MKTYRPDTIPVPDTQSDLLPVNELFYSIQGEGRWVGCPACFLRLHYCSVGCSWCDTKYTWSPNQASEMEWVSPNDVLSRLIHLIPEPAHNQQAVHLVITGGEPLLFQEQLIPVVTNAKEFGFALVEVETSGTIAPIAELMEQVNWWNCSPKLSNSGLSAERRIFREALSVIAGKGNADWKFVVRDERDVEEILRDYSELIPKDRVMLMPEGVTKNAQMQRLPLIGDLAMKYGFRVTARLHTLLWDNERGR